MRRLPCRPTNGRQCTSRLRAAATSLRPAMLCAKRVAPLIYLADGPRIVLVASLGGMPKHPVWYLNLEQNPDASFETRENGNRSYRARRANTEEKAALWPRLCAVYPDYADYQARTERDIPVMVLEPR